MKLLQNWRDVLRKSWCIRLIATAFGLLALDELAVLLEWAGMLDDRPAWSLGLRLAAMVVTAASFVARFVAQKNLNQPRRPDGGTTERTTP